MGKLKMGHSGVVAGERFWDRQKEIALFIERIDEGANQLLVAQRRMGKTSLMKETGIRIYSGGRETLSFYPSITKEHSNTTQEWHTQTCTSA